MTAIPELLEAARAAIGAMDALAEWVTDTPFGWHATNIQPVENELLAQLNRFRCTCGKFPTEGSVHGWRCVRCCGVEWDDWEGFLEWKSTQTET